MSQKKAAFGCSRTPPLPAGLYLKDVKNKNWTLGKTVGSGGFGDIYLIVPEDGKALARAEFVVKVEPHDNGPLFVEMHFFMRVAQSKYVEEWNEKNPSRPVRMPTYQGSGSFFFGGIKYRFLIMERFGNDLDKFFEGGKRIFSLQTIQIVSNQVINTLEFIHSMNYAHNDVKAQNLLIGLGAEGQDEVFLVDFGLACKYTDSQGYHKDGDPDERKAHDGTIEYTSRDAHTGAHSRRGDLETLGYNLIHWMTGELPWMDSLENPEGVAAMKSLCMKDIPALLKWCFRANDYPEALLQYLKYVSELKFESVPDYDQLRFLLSNFSHAANQKLNFMDSKLRELTEEVPVPMMIGVQSPNTRRRRNDPNSDATLDDVFNSDPNEIMKQSTQPEQISDKQAAFDKAQADSLLNPTAEMIRITKMNHDNKWSWRNVNKDGGKIQELMHKEDTPAMERVKSRIKEIKAAEKLDLEKNDSFSIPSTPMIEASTPIPDFNHSVSLISVINEAKILNFEVNDSITMESPQREANNFSWHQATNGQKQTKSGQEIQKEDSMGTNSPKAEQNISWKRPTQDKASQKDRIGLVNSPKTEPNNCSWNQPTIIKVEQKEDNFLWNRPSVFGTTSPHQGNIQRWNSNQSSTGNKISLNTNNARIEKEKPRQTNTEPLFHSIFGQQYLNDANTFISNPQENTMNCSPNTFIAKPQENTMNCSPNTFIAKPQEKTMNYSPKGEINSNDIAQTNEEIMAAFLQENSMQVPQRISAGNDKRRQHLGKSKPSEKKNEEIIDLEPCIKQENMYGSMEGFIKQEPIFEEKPINLEFTNFPNLQNTNTNPFSPILNFQQIKQEIGENIMDASPRIFGNNENQNITPERNFNPVSKKNVEAYKTQKSSFNMYSGNISRNNTGTNISNINVNKPPSRDGFGNFQSLQERKRTNSISFLDKTPTKQDSPFLYPTFQKKSSENPEQLSRDNFKTPPNMSINTKKSFGSPISSVNSSKSPAKLSTKDDNEVKILKVFLKPSRFNINGITPFIKSEPQEEIIEIMDTSATAKDSFKSVAQMQDVIMNKSAAPKDSLTNSGQPKFSNEIPSSKKPVETSMEFGKNSPLESSDNSRLPEVETSQDDEVQIIKVSLRPSTLSAGGIGPFIKSEPQDDSMDSSVTPNIPIPNKNDFPNWDHSYCSPESKTSKVDLFQPSSITTSPQVDKIQFGEKKSSQKVNQESSTSIKHPLSFPIHSSPIVKPLLALPIQTSPFSIQSSPIVKHPLELPIQTSPIVKPPLALPIQTSPIIKYTLSFPIQPSPSFKTPLALPIQTSEVDLFPSPSINTFSQLKTQENEELPSIAKSPVASTIQTGGVLFQSPSFPQVNAIPFGKNKLPQNDSPVENNPPTSSIQEEKPKQSSIPSPVVSTDTCLRLQDSMDSIVTPPTDKQKTISIFSIKNQESCPEILNISDIDGIKHKILDNPETSDTDVVQHKSKKMSRVKSKKVKPKSPKKKAFTISPNQKKEAIKVSPNQKKKALKNSPKHKNKTRLKEDPGLTPNTIKRQSLLRKKLRTSHRPNYALMNSHGLDDVDIANLNEETNKASWHWRLRPRKAPKAKKKICKQVMREESREGTVDNLFENMLLEGGNLM